MRDLGPAGGHLVGGQDVRADDGPLVEFLVQPAPHQVPPAAPAMSSMVVTA
jgi:hypothetical protein